MSSYIDHFGSTLSYVAQITLDPHGNRAARREERGDQGDPRVRRVGDGVTSMEEGKTKKGGRNRRRRKEERRKEKSEDEGGGKSKVKPVTEWARMTDWVVAVRTWIPGSGEEDNRWEVTKNRE